MADFGVDIALSMILKELERKGLIEENTDMEISGFFTDCNNKLFASNIPDDQLTEPTREELLDAFNAIEGLKKYYENRLDLLASIIKWAMIAPLSFVLKTSRLPYLKWIALWGFTKATKSSSGLIPLAFDGHHHPDSGFIKGQGSIDSVPRLGELISRTTFPIVVNEANLIDERMKHVIEYMKTAIDSTIIRDKFSNGKSKSTVSIPALSPLFLTSNFAMPVYNSAFMARIIERDHPKSEVHNPNDANSKEFDAALQNILDRLSALGRFRNWFIMNNQEFLKDKDLGFTLISKIHEHVGISMPEWFRLELPENQLEESLSDNNIDVRRAFEAYITKSYNRALAFWRFEKPEGIELDKATSDRLASLIQDNMLPDIKRQKGDNFTVLIYKGILEELYKLGVSRDQLPNLRSLADYMGAEYTKVHPGKNVVKAAVLNLKEYLD